METYTLTTRKKKDISVTQSNTSTTKHYQQLSAEERGQIQSWHEDHYSIRQITARLHRDPAEFTASLSGERFASSIATIYLITAILLILVRQYTNNTA